MKIIPKYDHAVIKPSKTEKKTKHGLVLDDELKGFKGIGEVIEVGSGVNNEIDIFKGDKVFYRHLEINEIGDYVLVRDEDILAVIKEEK